MSTVIKVENLSKLYRLGDVGTGTITHDVNRWWHRIRGKEDPYLKIGETNDRTFKGSSDYVWALKDINFEVKQGEVLGIIGRNGAGKSTLLKILSRTTAPTTGSVKIKGRVASLLEVGTGFHPELSGRDNIFLNGAIMGMTRREIQSKFDEIVDFAGVERYIDTPVKRYSSGMYVRLAFAVAAHLDPEILIVDEVLAVGDAEFQKKCLGKMKDVSEKQGRTVLFVSHNMLTLQSLCRSGILIFDGRIRKNAPITDIIDSYFNSSEKAVSEPLSLSKNRVGLGLIRFDNIEIFSINNLNQKTLLSGSKVYIKISFSSAVSDIFKNCRVSIAIKSNENPLILLSSELIYDKVICLKNGSKIEFCVQKLPLSRGVYSLTFFIESNNDVQDWLEDASEIQVEDADFYGEGINYPKGWSGKTVLVEHTLKVYD